MNTELSPPSALLSKQQARVSQEALSSFAEYGRQNLLFWALEGVEVKREKLKLYRGVIAFDFSLADCLRKKGEEKILQLFSQETRLEDFHFQILVRQDFLNKHRGNLASALQNSKALL